MSEEQVAVAVCAACSHALSWHFMDVTGVVRCTVEYHGTSDRGVIGIPWHARCGCADYKVPQPPVEKPQELPPAFKKIVQEALSDAQRACKDYSRPKGIMGGPCLNCGRSQPEHVRRG